MALLLGCGGDGSSFTAESGGGGDELAVFGTAGVIPDGGIRALLAPGIAGAGEYMPGHIEFSGPKLRELFGVPGVHVYHAHDRWADVLIPKGGDTVAKIRSSTGFVWMDWSEQSVVPPPPPSVPAASRAIAEATARGGVGGLKGRGVVIAIVDSGLDFRHPDFIRKDAAGRPESRILAFWDTTSDAFAKKGVGGASPFTYPNGASIGTVYTRDQLTEELRKPGRIGSLDLNGHGTACAGIAAGSGPVGDDLVYTGVAPEADLVAVRIGGSKEQILENTFLLGAACTWVESVSAGKPFVVSCSLGGQFAGRDGFWVLERQLNARFADGAKSRSLCIAAGNEGRDDLHAEVQAASPQKFEAVSWTVPERGRAALQIFVAAADISRLGVRSLGSTKIPVERGVQGYINTLSKTYSASFTNLLPGSYSLGFGATSGSPIRIDAYLATEVELLPQEENRPRFTGPSAVARHQMGTPGTCLNAITVGSYDFNDQLLLKGRGACVYGGKADPLKIGGISDFTNPGPLRIGGVVKPDFAAPGRFHVVPQASGAPEPSFLHPSGRYAFVAGTSSATPYAAGVIALMLQKNPGLTAGEIRTLLRANLTKDLATGSVPNAAWGHGKLDLRAVRAALGAVRTR
jgi:subtilisin family serine protease